MNKKNENKPVAIHVSGVKKMYRLGQIGGGSLRADIESWWARCRGKVDPNTIIGEESRSKGDVFMALNGINLTIYQGEAVGIIGSNGAGKSTLLKLLSKVTAPTEGEIDIFGRIASMLEVGTGFNGELTGRENVYMNGAILGMTKQEIDAKMEEIIEFSEVREFIDTPVKRYSSGMFVKLAFSVAAHLDSEIMIMDEVLAVGDMSFQKKCLDKMRDAAKKEGRTVLYVSHNMGTIKQLCDRCIVLDAGRVIFEGDVEEAIQLYLDSGEGDSIVDYNFTLKYRDNPVHAQKAIIHNFSFQDRKKATFLTSERLKAQIQWEAYSDLENVKIIMTFKNPVGEDLGMSESINILEKTKKGHHTVLVDLDISNIAEGRYFILFSIVIVDDLMNVCELDETSKIPIKIIDDNTQVAKWQPEYWGYWRMNQLTLIET